MVYFLYTLAGYLAQSTLRHLKARALLLFSLPLLLTPIWVQTTHDPFVWIKAYLVPFSTLPLILYPRHPKKPLAFLIYLLLALNILLAGLRCPLLLPSTLFLILSFPPLSALSYHQTDLTWDISPLWITGYTLWGLTFVALTFPAHILHQAACLTAPLLAPRLLYLQARAFSLSFYFLIAMTFPYFLEQGLVSENWASQYIQALQTITPTWTGIYFISTLIQKIFSKNL
jgi:hypothetical protein